MFEYYFVSWKWQQLFEILVKNKKEVYEQIIEMTKNNGYTADNLLDYEHFKHHYQLIPIDLSKKLN